MAYWLLKSEPYQYSWDRLVSERTTSWEGIRNYQASHNMKAMKIGDQGFFYHSNVGKAIMGIVQVIKPYYPDHTDSSGRFGMVDVEIVKPLPKPVPLAAVKAHPALQNLALVRQGRLSVSPVSPEAWSILCEMGGL